MSFPSDQSNPAGAIPVYTTAESVPPTGAATSALQEAGNASLASIDAKAPALLSATPAPAASGVPVREVGNDLLTVSFVQSGSGLLTDKMTQRALGSGMAVSQASGALVVTTGTSARSEFLARTLTSFTAAHIATFDHLLSQRIANNNFMMLVADIVGEGLSCTINSATSITVTKTGHGFTSSDVGQSMFVGAITGAAGVPGYYAIASVPSANTLTLTVAGWPASGSCTVDLFGYNYYQVLYNGTTATSATFNAARRGWGETATTITTLTTATPGHMMQCKATGRDVFIGDTLAASATTPTITTRGSRLRNVPDDNTALYAYLWAYNGTSAPASTTTWTVNGIAVEPMANQTVFVAGQRMQGTEAPAPVSISNTPSMTVSGNPVLGAGSSAIGDVGLQYRASSTGAASLVAVQSPASPAAATIKGSAGRLLGFQLQNSAASLRSVKVFNATAPTLGSTSAQFEIDIPAGGRAEFRLEGGIAFSTAITYSVTSAKGLTDNTATGLALNDVSGSFYYA